MNSTARVDLLPARFGAASLVSVPQAPYLKTYSRNSFNNRSITVSMATKHSNWRTLEVRNYFLPEKIEYCIRIESALIVCKLLRVAVINTYCRREKFTVIAKSELL